MSRVTESLLLLAKSILTALNKRPGSGKMKTRTLGVGGQFITDAIEKP